MSATPHDVVHAQDVIARNPDISLDALLNHPNKKWDDEAKRYFQKLIAPKPEPIMTTAIEKPIVAIAEVAAAPGLIQPDVDGKFPTPLDGALFMASLGIPQTPLRARTKIAFLPEFQKSATTDFAQIRKWAEEYPGCNFGSLGRAGEFFTFEADSTEVRKRFEDTGGTFSSQLIVASRPGRGHRWYRSTPEVKNISQAYTKHGDFSVRALNQYCCSPGSVHPDTGEQYRLISAGAPEVPSAAEIAFWESERVEKNANGKTETPRNERRLVSHGNVHGYLLSEAGRLRNLGLGEESIRVALYELVEKNVEKPIDYKKVDAMAKSVCNWQAGTDISIILNQTPSSSTQATTPVAQVPLSEAELKLDTSNEAVRPVFPLWAIQGTSIYENLVKPAVETSSKFEEFIFMPALQIMANYLSRNVSIELQPTNLNLFVGLVSPYGHFFKSTSCELAYRYFECVGICGEMTKSIKSAEGKVFTFQAGSPEGFGLRMHKANCRRAILFNDELGKFVSKAGIESSSFSSDLLTWYGSGSYGNNVKSEKDSFSFESGTYTFGWLWCTTDRGFNRHWPKLAGMSSGLGDRLFFVISPEKPKPAGPYSTPDYREGALKTKKLIDEAINQRTFQIEEPEMYARRVKGMDPRSMDMVLKLALILAVDLGLKIIDDDCVDRARALVDYRNQAAAYLEPIEADNVEGRLQKEVLRELRQNRGKLSYRELCRNLDFGRYGMRLWRAVYHGLVNHGDVVEFQECRTPGKRATRMVGLVKHDEDE
jgi:hypothetical protein